MSNKRKAYLIIFIFCAVNLILRLIADGNSGFQADELLHIETGNHPDWGYMEFPPVIGWLAWVQNQFHSQSVFVHHIFTHLASTLIIVLLGAIVTELGGGVKALSIALLCVLVSPGYGRSFQLFQPVVFTQFFWVLGFYQLVRFNKTLEVKYLYCLIAACAFGFLTKYDSLFFIAGLSSLFFFARSRAALFPGPFWYCVLLFMLIISPNLWWEYNHHFPVVQHFSRLYQTQLNDISALKNFTDLVIGLNPFSAIIWLGGMVYMFTATDKQLYRPVAISIVLSVCILAISKGKSYYFFPAMLTIIAIGSVWFEQRVLAKRRWPLYALAAILLASGYILIPYGLAVLPLNSFIKFAHIKKEDNRYKVHYQEYYSKQLWHNTLAAIKRAYNSLPDSDKKDCRIWGKHYSQAGAVNLYRGDWQLPEAFSYHGSFYLWAPDGKMPAAVIVFNSDESGIDFWKPFFGTIIPFEKITNPYAEDSEDGRHYQTVYICRNPKQSFTDLKEIFKNRVFE